MLTMRRDKASLTFEPTTAALRSMSRSPIGLRECDTRSYAMSSYVIGGPAMVTSGAPQQAHLGIMVEDVAAAAPRVLALGATPVGADASTPTLPAIPSA